MGAVVSLCPASEAAIVQRPRIVRRDADRLAVISDGAVVGAGVAPHERAVVERADVSGLRRIASFKSAMRAGFALELPVCAAVRESVGVLAVEPDHGVNRRSRS